MPDTRNRAELPADRPVRRRWRALPASLAVALAVASVPVAAWAIPPGAPPAQEEAEAGQPAAGEVIADGRARLPRGEIAWTLRRLDVPAGDDLAVDEFPLGFALVDTGTVALRAEGEENPTQIAAGEAAFLPDRKAGTLANTGDAPAAFYEIALVSQRDAQSAAEDGDAEETGVVVGEPFPAPQGAAPEEPAPEVATPEGEEPEAASFEIELTRNTLSGQDTATIPVSGSGAPVFYLTTDGTAQLQAGEQVVELAAGQFALLAGEVQVRAAGEAPATFVVAAIGEEAEERERGERAGREDRQRVRDGGPQADGAPRARRTREGRTPRVRTGGGGRGGGGQGQQPGPGAPGGQPGTGAPTVPPPDPGTPGVDPTPEATVPVEPTVPADGTPPPDATIPPVDETAVPTETVPPAETPPPIETPTPEPTVFVPPTNPPVPEVPGLPTVPPAETVPTEPPPAEAPPPVEETPAAPIEEEAADPASGA